MNIAELDTTRVEPLLSFFLEIPDEDLTFVKEDVTDLDTMRGWAGRPGRRWVAFNGASIIGFAAVLPFTGLSDHVAELRLVVHPGHRRHGVGRALARHALSEAVRAGRRKLIVELGADQRHTIAMFSSLGFIGEALLRDHIRDRSGKVHDLVMLAHFVDTTWSMMDTVGLVDELGTETTPS